MKLCVGSRLKLCSGEAQHLELLRTFGHDVPVDFNIKQILNIDHKIKNKHNTDTGIPQKL